MNDLPVKIDAILNINVIVIMLLMLMFIDAPGFSWDIKLIKYPSMQLLR